MKNNIPPIIISALAKRSETEILDIITLINDKKSECKQEVEFITFESLSQWHTCSSSGNIQHNSHNFFSISGININSEKGIVSNWQQPIIHQPEIGILGIICKQINNTLHFLLQLKAEPGNINKLQLSPTLQATRSNFTKVHKGHAPSYLDFFTAQNKYKTIVNVLQSEQGARFYKKRNQNIIIEVDSDIKVKENFLWLTLGQIYELMKIDNLVNMDTRTVISCIPFQNILVNADDLKFLVNNEMPGNRCPVKLAISKSLFLNDFSLYSTSDIISWFTNQKITHQLDSHLIPLNQVKNWKLSSHDISHIDNKYFSVKACKVFSPDREVKTWDQPIIQPRHKGLIVLFIKKIQGTYHFLIQAKEEPGVIDKIEIAATIQCITGTYKNIPKEYWPKYLEYFLNSSIDKIIYDSMQSEEGGRFFQESNRNVIIEVNEDFEKDNTGTHIWVTLRQLKSFIQYNNFVNIQCRSLISCLGLF